MTKERLDQIAAKYSGEGGFCYECAGTLSQIFVDRCGDTSGHCKPCDRWSDTDALPVNYDVQALVTEVRRLQKGDGK